MSRNTYSFHGKIHLESSKPRRRITKRQRALEEALRELRSIPKHSQVKKMTETATDKYINLKKLIPEIASIHHIEESHTRKIKDELVGKLKIPDNITHIGKNTFSCCNQLTGIDFPDNLKHINSGAFNMCYMLTTIRLPKYLTDIRISSSAFSNCPKLTDIVFPDNLKKIESITLGLCSNLKVIVLPDKLEHLGNFAFYGCRKLTDIVLPYGLKTIGYSPFLDCTQLTNIRFAGRFESFQDAIKMACHVELPLNSTRTAEWNEKSNGYQMTCRGVWEPRNGDPQAPNETFLIGLDQPFLIQTLGGDEYPVEFSPGEPQGTNYVGENGFPEPPPIDLRKLLLQTYPTELGPEPGKWSFQNPENDEQTVATLTAAEIIEANRTGNLKPDKPLMLVWDEEPEEEEGEAEVQGLNKNNKNIKRRKGSVKKPKKKGKPKTGKTNKKEKKGSIKKKPTKKKRSKKKK